MEELFQIVNLLHAFPCLMMTQSLLSSAANKVIIRRVASICWETSPLSLSETLSLEKGVLDHPFFLLQTSGFPAVLQNRFYPSLFTDGLTESLLYFGHLCLTEETEPISKALFIACRLWAGYEKVSCSFFPQVQINRPILHKRASLMCESHVLLLYLFSAGYLMPFNF